MEKARDHIETGAKVVVTVEASLEADQLKLLARSVAPIDATIANAGTTGLRLFVENPQAISSVASVLMQSKNQSKGSPKGPIQFCLMDHGIPGEITVDVGEEFPVNPQIKGALKSLAGVMQVEEI